MYVDETGTPEFSDQPRYFLLTGVIVHESEIKNVKKQVFDFKQKFFDNTYIESEIHMHEMWKSKNDFRPLRGDDRTELITKMYEMISQLPIKVIGAAINKPRILLEKPNWSVLKTAFIILASRYNTYLQTAEGYSDIGTILMDNVSNKRRMEISKIMKMLHRDSQNNQVRNILDEPKFVNSDSFEGIQVADAISFCIGKKLMGNPKFPARYWDMIKDKIHSDDDGKLLGYGLNVFPYMKELENEDIQP